MKSLGAITNSVHHIQQWVNLIFYTVVFQDLPSTKGQLILKCPFGVFISTK